MGSGRNAPTTATAAKCVIIGSHPILEKIVVCSVENLYNDM